ncbi:MAG: mechanosensitive ion channel family protein [Candidatus Aureabacteria bacterium]|nr:mechanosensitive ion channel family protein [Candidatus Auribacterota bacterium]
MQSLAVILVFYIIFLIVNRVINTNVADLRKRYLYRKVSFYVITIIGFLVFARVWINQMASVTMFLSFLGGGIALALHQVILSVAGWLLIIVKGYYNIGDRIEIGPIKGDIIDISVFYTTCMEIGNWVESDQSTGRMVQFPNSRVFTEPVYNYTRGFEYIWNEITILVTFESDWKKAEEILTNIIGKYSVEVTDTVRKRIQKMAQKYWIHYEILTPIVYTTIKDSGIQLNVRYLTDVKKRRMTEVQISREVLKAFSKEPSVEFAYPTTRFYKRGEEEGR